MAYLAGRGPLISPKSQVERHERSQPGGEGENCGWVKDGAPKGIRQEKRGPNSPEQTVPAYRHGDLDPVTEIRTRQHFSPYSVKWRLICQVADNPSSSRALNAKGHPAWQQQETVRLGRQGLFRNPWRAHEDSYGTSPGCRHIHIHPVRGRPSALRCTASDAAR
ncbi:hypothetical protein [Streptomyces sp. NPDC017520]|uniref:hypothetical protein n=1 Tax=Streptomyces sp. NPDC017520 TaxID=3364998 RepID=UPI00378E04EF